MAANPEYDGPAQGNRRQGSAVRTTQTLGDAGVRIMNSGNQNRSSISGRQISEIMNMGEKYVPKHQRDGHATNDINGSVKKNKYGAVMSMDQRLVNETAG